MAVERVTFILNAGRTVRREMLEGKQYLVVPMVMITEGVFEGSAGKLFYSGSELGKTPAVWNHKPVISYHPADDAGQAISACDPAILEARKVGLIMNTQWAEQDKKLRAEAWLDEEKLRKVDGRVLDAINAGQVIEISTGLFTDNESVKGEWNGKPYDAVAKNLRPDHLAILYDKKGACSVADGAGLLANEATVPVTLNREFGSAERKKLAKSGAAMKDGSFPISTEQDLHNAIRAIGRAKNPASAKRHIIERAKALGKSDVIPETWRMSNNESCSYGQVQDQLHAMLSSKYGKPGQRWNGYVEDLYPNQVIYSNEGDLYSHTYSIDGTNYVKLTGEPKKMKRIASYIPHDYQTIGRTDGITDGYGTTGIIHEGMQVFQERSSQVPDPTNNAKKEPTPQTHPHLFHADGRAKNRQERAGHMIEKGGQHGYKKEHEGFLANMPEEHFAMLEAAVHRTGHGSTTADTQPTNPAMTGIQATGGGSPLPGHTTPQVPGFNQQNGQPLTLEQYIAIAPPAFREIIVNALNTYTAQRTQLIQMITANANNKFRQDYLERMTLEDLTALVALMGSTQQPGQQQVMGGLAMNGAVPNYLLAPGAVNQQQPVVNLGVLPTPGTVPGQEWWK